MVLKSIWCDGSAGLCALQKGARGLFGVLKTAEKKATPAAQDMLTSDAEMGLRHEIDCLVRVFRLFREGVLLMDEVDLLLHPLRSELHWPLGLRLPLDFTQAKMGDGLRWKLPQWLLSAITAAWDGRLTKDVDDSQAGLSIIAELKAAFAAGVRERKIQEAPHPVLLDRAFYKTKLRPALTQWALLWLHEHGAVRSVPACVLLEYLTAGPHAASTATLQAVTGALPDDCVKALNLLHDWLSTLLPHCLGKVNRVRKGLFEARNGVVEGKGAISREDTSFVRSPQTTPISRLKQPLAR